MRLRYRILVGLSVLIAIALAAGFAAWAGLRAYYVPQLPSVESLKDINPGAPLRIFSSDGKLIGEFGAERRIPLRFEQIPKPLIQAFLAAEDDRFYSHPGVDWQGLLRAAFVLASTGEKRQGGSTITMQLARGVFLSRERSFDRKFKEIFLALKIEHELTKDQILELYLNRIFLGSRAYGVGAAAQVYFGKSVDELSTGEMAILAGLPKAPSRDNPLASPEHARERRDYVLRRMHDLGDIDDEQFKLAMAEPITSQEHVAPVDVDAGYVAEMVRSEMVQRYGESAYSNGYVVTTTIDSARQLTAQHALRDAVYAYEERHGYDGAEGHVPADAEAALSHPTDSEALKAVLNAQTRIADLIPAIVLSIDADEMTLLTEKHGVVKLPKSGYAWASLSARRALKPGDIVHLRRDDKDWRLSHMPSVQAAFVALDPHDGAIQALVGGYDFAAGKYNRVTQARRQVGSGFKPFLYSAALAKGYTPASVFLDAPVVFANADYEDDWRPENYSRSFNGPMRLRDALAQSRNLVSIRLLQATGLDYVIDFVQRFGLPKDELPDNLTLALGTAALTPMEMARGYSVIANGGYLIDPYFIRSIHRGSEELFHADPAPACTDCPDGQPSQGGKAAKRVLDPDVDYLITSMMHDVVTRGTAARVSQLGRDDLAGKTGTTNDETDAWFNGFQPTLVAVCWMGFDQPRPLGRGEVGGRAALPMWMDFMRSALKGVPQKPLPRPDDIVDVLINPATGKRVDPGFPGAISEVFSKNNLPPPDDGHIPGQEGSTLTDQLY